MTKTTYRLLHFPKVDRYVGLAWNYDEAVMITTDNHASYTEARNELESLAAMRFAELRWFDGEYTVENDIILPKES